MKRDEALMREILEYVEGQDGDVWLQDIQEALEYPAKTITEHVQILIDDSMFEYDDRSDLKNPVYLIYRLTMRGHDNLAMLRNPPEEAPQTIIHAGEMPGGSADVYHQQLGQLIEWAQTLPSRDNVALKALIEDIQTFIRRAFGSDSPYTQELSRIEFGPSSVAYMIVKDDQSRSRLEPISQVWEKGRKTLIALLEKMKRELETFGPSTQKSGTNIQGVSKSNITIGDRSGGDMVKNNVTFGDADVDKASFDDVLQFAARLSDDKLDELITKLEDMRDGEADE